MNKQIELSKAEVIMVLKALYQLEGYMLSIDERNNVAYGNLDVASTLLAKKLINEQWVYS